MTNQDNPVKVPLKLNAAVFWLELVRADLGSCQIHFCHWCCREETNIEPR